jgi:hypothetical protein
VRRKERNFDDIESSEDPVREVLDAVLDHRAANRIKNGRAAGPTRGMLAIHTLPQGDSGAGSLAKMDLVLSADGPASA